MIAVVGGGISGLAVAHALKERGREVQVFEAAASPGGKVGTQLKDGYTLENGPNGFLDNEPATLKLVDKLGLGPQLRRAETTAKRRFIYTAGAVKEVHASPKLFSSDILSLTGRLRLLAEPFSRRGPEEESLASFARRHLGDEATSILIDAVQSGIFAGDSERLSVDAVFPKLKAIEREHRSLVLGMLRSRQPRPQPSTLCSFEGGLQTLVEALAERVKPRAAPVQALARAGDGWKLSLEGETVTAEQVILSVPAFAAAPFLRPFAADAAEALLEIPYAPVAVVHLGYRRAELSQLPDGFGFLVPHRERRELLGVLYISSFFPWRAPVDGYLMTVMLGGARHPEVMKQDVVAVAREELRQTLGITAEPKLAEAVKWERGIPQYELGHASRLQRIDRAVARIPGLHVTGNAYRGVGLNDCIRNAKALAERL